MNNETVQNKLVVLETRAVKRAKDNLALHLKHDTCFIDQFAAALEQAEKDAPALIERDTMPVQVATEMLCVPAGEGRMTARQRKTYQSAREKHYASQLSATAGVYKVAEKFRGASFAQLSKWLKRARWLQKNLERATTKPALQRHPQKEYLLKVLLAKLMSVAQTIELLTDELTRRAALTNN